MGCRVKDWVGSSVGWKEVDSLFKDGRLGEIMRSTE